MIFNACFFVFLPIMMTKSRAIVLRTVKYGDDKMIVDMLTMSGGRVSFILRISKTSKGRIKRQLFMPMTILEVDFDFRQNLKLQHIRDVRLAVPLPSLAVNPYKISIVLFLSEVLSAATVDEHHNESLFSFVADSLNVLDKMQSGFANFHLVFLCGLTAFIGFMPNTENYRDGDFFDLREGCFVSVQPVHGDALDAHDSRLMLSLLRVDYKSMRLFRMSHVDRNRCLDVLMNYYRLHIPSFPDIKSLDVLKQIYE